MHEIVERGASRIDIRKIGGRRKPTVVHHADGQPCLHCAACAERMAKMALKGMERDPIAVDLMRGLGFRDVPLVRGRAVPTDEADVLARRVAPVARRCA